MELNDPEVLFKPQEVEIIERQWIQTNEELLKKNQA